MTEVGDQNCQKHDQNGQRPWVVTSVGNVV